MFTHCRPAERVYPAFNFLMLMSTTPIGMLGRLVPSFDQINPVHHVNRLREREGPSSSWERKERFLAVEDERSIMLSLGILSAVGLHKCLYMLSNCALIQSVFNFLFSFFLVGAVVVRRRKLRVGTHRPTRTRNVR